MLNLYVTVHSARYLVSKDGNGHPDSFVLLEVGSHVEKTQVVKKTSSPSWEQSFTLRVVDPSKQKLCLTVYEHCHIGKDKSMGEISLPLNTLTFSKEITDWIPLGGVKAGRLLITLKALDFGLPDLTNDENLQHFREQQVKMNQCHSEVPISSSDSASPVDPKSDPNIGPNEGNVSDSFPLSNTNNQKQSSNTNYEINESSLLSTNHFYLPSSAPAINECTSAYPDEYSFSEKCKITDSPSGVESSIPNNSDIGNENSQTQSDAYAKREPTIPEQYNNE